MKQQQCQTDDSEVSTISTVPIFSLRPPNWSDSLKYSRSEAVETGSDSTLWLRCLRGRISSVRESSVVAKSMPRVLPHPPRFAVGTASKYSGFSTGPLGGAVPLKSTRTGACDCCWCCEPILHRRYGWNVSALDGDWLPSLSSEAGSEKKIILQFVLLL